MRLLFAPPTMLADTKLQLPLALQAVTTNLTASSMPPSYLLAPRHC